MIQPAAATASSLLNSLAEPSAQQVADARKTREAFTQWVGETFYAQMLKSMRATVGKPAYFHGGNAEETFRTQLDMHLAEELAESTGERFAEPLFERQFPQQAGVLRRTEQAKATSSGLEQLQQLGRAR